MINIKFQILHNSKWGPESRDVGLGESNLNRGQLLEELLFLDCRHYKLQRQRRKEELKDYPLSFISAPNQGKINKLLRLPEKVWLWEKL